MMAVWLVSAVAGAVALAVFVPLCCALRPDLPRLLHGAILGAAAGASAGYLLVAGGLLGMVLPGSGAPGPAAYAGWMAGCALAGAYLALGVAAVRTGPRWRRQGAGLGLSLGLLTGLALLLAINLRIPGLTEYLPPAVSVLIGLVVLAFAAPLGAMAGSLAVHDPSQYYLAPRWRVFAAVPAALLALLPLIGGLKLVEAGLHVRSVTDMAAKADVTGLLYRLSYGDRGDRQMAADALAAFADDPRVRDGLIAATADPDEFVACSAAQALEGCGGPEVIAALEAMLGHPAVSVRYTAAWSLARKSLKGDSAAREALKTAERDPDRNVRAVALRGLEKLYVVRCGTYGLKTGADIALKSLQRQGLEAEVVPVRSGRRQAYAVVLGAYPEQRQAERIAELARSAGFRVSVEAPE